MDEGRGAYPLGDMPTVLYTGLNDMKTRIDHYCSLLREERTSHQYIAFLGVTKDTMAFLEQTRWRIGQCIRITYIEDRGMIITKLMPCGRHEVAHTSLGFEVKQAFARLGMDLYAWADAAATTCRGQRSSKEGDTSFRPLSTRPAFDNWPTLVIEAGESESLPHLRTDARWWLANSGDDVKMVLIVSVKLRPRTLRVEKWMNAVSSVSPSNMLALCTQTVEISQQPPANVAGGTPSYLVAGAPLVLEIEKLLDRTPVPPEANVVWDETIFKRWAAWYWSQER